MNFNDTPEEAAFRKEVRAWIDANAPRHLETALRQVRLGSLELRGADIIAESKAWQKRKFDAGWACLHWPAEYGGRGATPIERVIWQQEEGIYALLSAIFIIGQGMCGPTLLVHAAEKEKRRYLPPIASGEEIWCQLFSEPAAGSDLAGLCTRAERDGGDWLINGQKIWTSVAQHADYGLLLARTNPELPKHKGLAMFFLSMRSPGVEIRPIKQADGKSDFSEVFFTGVRIPDTQRLGKVGEGWQVSLTTLMHERLSIGLDMRTGFPELFEFCCRSTSPDGRPLIEDRAVRARLSTWAVRTSGLKYGSLRAISALSKGETPGPEHSIGKLVAAGMMQEIAAFALDLQGEAGAILDPSHAAFAAEFQDLLLRAPANRLAGGTDEILRNIIAERVLGLPGDIRVDKGVPFREVPTTEGR